MYAFPPAHPLTPRVSVSGLSDLSHVKTGEKTEPLLGQAHDPLQQSQCREVLPVACASTEARPVARANRAICLTETMTARREVVGVVLIYR